MQHSFWVVLGTLSVLRSNALNTGQNVMRGLLGTVVGFVVGGALLQLIGTNTTVLWFLLPLAILLAGVAPAAISFAAGQAAFTLTLVFLYNIIQPAGWRVGLLRIEDIAIGCAREPRRRPAVLAARRGGGAAAARSPRRTPTASTISPSAVDFGMRRCDADAAGRRGAGRRRRARGRGGPPPGRHLPQLPGRARGKAGAARRDDQPGQRASAGCAWPPMPCSICGSARTARAVGDRSAARGELLQSSERDQALV